MPELPLERLRLRVRDRERLTELLRQRVPSCEVWAYGSRVDGSAHDASDLDLVVRNPSQPMKAAPHLDELRDAFVESDLPIRVEVLDWARIPESFRDEIERQYVVVQEGKRALT